MESFDYLLLVLFMAVAVFFPAHLWGLLRGRRVGREEATKELHSEVRFQKNCAECAGRERDAANSRIKELEKKIEAAKDILY